MDDFKAVSTQSDKNRLTLSLDPRWVIVALLLIIIAMFAIWKPWNNNPGGASARTIKVSGQATVKAEPDEFVFSPTYTITNADRETALAAMTKKSTDLIAKLKALGLQDGQIKSNVDSYSRELMYYPEKPDGGTPSYTLQLTITAGKRDQAQKVQDYLGTTSPAGSVTPSASFSTAKRKQLESQARDQATKDARGKADQSAKNLGFKVGKVKSVNDGSGFGIMPAYERGAATDSASPSMPPTLDIQPGENELSYSVDVEYYVR